MRYVTEGAESVKKTVGGKTYGYLYLPRSWIGASVLVIRFERPKEKQKTVESPKVRTAKRFASKKLIKMGYKVSDTGVNIDGTLKSSAIVGSKGNRMVIATAIMGKTVKSVNIDEDLSSASNVLYIVVSSKAVLTKAAKRKVSELGNIVIWRYET